MRGHDPYYDADHLRRRGFEPWDASQPSPVRIAILQAAHAAYRQLDLRTIPGLELLVDGRNALDSTAVIAAGITYLGIGR